MQAVFAVLVFLWSPVAKSAQFPLHVWLPDAMGMPHSHFRPDHAATMVAAGVFLCGADVSGVCGAHPHGDDRGGLHRRVHSPLLGSHHSAITQTDIKKGLALLSPCPSWAYMVMAMGAGAYRGRSFHLITHAYFKAMLFLGSGSVIPRHGSGGGHDPRPLASGHARDGRPSVSTK